MNAKPEIDAGHQCPVCKKSLQIREYRRALRELEKVHIITVKQYREDLGTFRNALRELKSLHQKQMRTIIDNEKTHHESMYKKLEEQRKGEKRKFNEEARTLKKEYRAQIERTRQLYSSHYEQLESNLRVDYENMLTGLVKRYEELSEQLVKQLEGLQSDSAISSSQDTPKNVVEKSQLETGQNTDFAQLKENLNEKNLEVKRLQELRFIGQMIKEIAESHQDGK